MIPAFHIDIPWLNLFAGVGILAAVFYLERVPFFGHLRRNAYLNAYLLVILLLSVAASRFFNIFLLRDTLNYSWWDLLRFGGLTYYGGMISFYCIAAVSCGVLFRVSTRDFLYNVIPAIVIFHAFARIGCFFQGCCYGKTATAPFSCLFERYPSQLIESFFLFIVFLVIIRLRSNRLAFHFFGYGVIRFFVEFTRGDDRGQLLGVATPSQEISVILMAAAAAVFGVNEVVRRRTGRDIFP